MFTRNQGAGTCRELALTIRWMADFNLQAARTNAVYRAARLTLLRIRARKTFERTDASMREVEAASAEAKAGMRDPKVETIASAEPDRAPSISA